MSVDGCLAVSLFGDCQSDRLKALPLRTMAMKVCHVCRDCICARPCQTGHIRKYTRQLFSHGFQNNVNNIHCPFIERQTQQKQMRWYKLLTEKWMNSVYQALCSLLLPTASGTVSFPKGYNRMGRQLVLLVKHEQAALWQSCHWQSTEVTGCLVTLKWGREESCDNLKKRLGGLCTGCRVAQYFFKNCHILVHKRKS